MTKHEAKTILHASRTSGADASDPAIAEALAFAQNDPELRAWFDEWQALDRSIAAKLKAAALPDALLEQVRSGAAERATASPRKMSPRLAVAACVALIGLLAVFILTQSGGRNAVRPLALLQEDMAVFLNEFPQLDVETDRLLEVQEWLADRHPLTAVSIPVGLEPFPTIGCRTVQWGDRELALVCFMVDGEVVHLLMLPARDVPGSPDGSAPQFATAGRFRTATWSSGETQYLALTPGGEDLLPALL